MTADLAVEAGPYACPMRSLTRRRIVGGTAMGALTAIAVLAIVFGVFMFVTMPLLSLDPGLAPEWIGIGVGTLLLAVSCVLAVQVIARRVEHRSSN